MREDIGVSAALAELYKEVVGLPDWQSHVANKLERRFEKREVSLLESLTGPFPGKRILDVGCGFGGALIEIGRSGGAPVGVEIDPKRARMAKLWASENGVDAALVVGNAERLPFKDEEFDLICCYEVLEHVERPRSLLSELGRVVKPGGIVHLTTPHPLSLIEAHYKVRYLPLVPRKVTAWWLKRRGRNPQFFLSHVRYVWPWRLRAWFKELGFDVRQVSGTRIAEKLYEPTRIHTSGHKLIAVTFAHLRLTSVLAWVVTLRETLAGRQGQNYLAVKSLGSCRG